MKNKWLGIVLFSCVLLVVGCQPTAGQLGLEHEGGAHQEIQGKNETSIYSTEQPNREQGTRMGRNQIPYGYVEHSADDPEVISAGYGANMYIDRHVLADGVAQIVVGLQDVEHAAVLITDDECIIGYQGTEDYDELKEQVELSGLSLTPRWFKVYATSDIQLIRSIRNLANFQDAQHTEDQIEQQIQQIIQQLGGPKESWDNLDIQNFKKTRE